MLLSNVAGWVVGRLVGMCKVVEVKKRQLSACTSYNSRPPVTNTDTNMCKNTNTNTDTNADTNTDTNIDTNTDTKTDTNTDTNTNM